MGRINKKLLPLKMLLFFLYAAIGCLPAFLTIHMFHIGLTHEEVTWINTVLPLTALVGPPFVGYLADRFGHYRLITITSMFLAGIFHTALLFVPERAPMSHPPSLHLICSTEGSSLILQSCPEECPIAPNDLQGSFRIDNCRQECELEGRHCGSISLPSISSPINTTLFNVESEVSVDNALKPNICFHNIDNVICNDFEYTTSVKMKTGLETAYRNLSYYGSFSDCCEYPVLNYSTGSARFSNMTCNPKPNCHVVCSVREVSKDGSVIQMPVCSKVTFWLYFCLRAVADLFPAILISLFDAVVLTMVEQHGGDYGRQKMFGLFAIGTSSPIVGYFIDAGVGVHGNYDYAPVFYTFDVLLILTCVITLLLPLKVEVQRTSMLKNLTELVRTSEFNVLVLIVMILGSLNGYLETFLYIHLSKELGASSLLLGLTITVGIVPSLPFLYRSDPIVNYCGHHYLLMLAFIGYCVRFAGLSYLANPYWVIPLEMLELFTINLMQVTTATLAYKLAPKTLVATAQGLVWISHFDIGRALGTIVGGYLIKEYGMIRVFQGASVFSAICATIYLTIHQVFKYIKANRIRRQSAQQRKENGAISNGNYMPLPVINKTC